MSDGTIRNFIGRVHIETGSMGVGFVIVADDDKFGPLPIASVSLPLKTAAESRAVAEYIADCWNDGLGGKAERGGDGRGVSS